MAPRPIPDDSIRCVSLTVKRKRCKNKASKIATSCMLHFHRMTNKEKATLLKKKLEEKK